MPLTGKLIRQVVDALLADGVIDREGHRMLRDDLAGITRPAATVVAHCPSCGTPARRAPHRPAHPPRPTTETEHMRMIRTTTLATVAGSILGASAVLTVQALRRHRTRQPQQERSPEPTPEPVPPVVPVEVVPVADVPPARNGDRPPTPNLDKILAQRAAEQRDEPD